MKIFAFVRLHFRFHLLSRLFPKRTPTHSWQKPSNAHIHRTHWFLSLLSITHSFILPLFWDTPSPSPVSDNTEANMRADKFGRKPLTGIIRMEVEERGEDRMKGGDEWRLSDRVWSVGSTWPPPGWVSSLQRAGKGSTRMGGDQEEKGEDDRRKKGKDVFLQMHHGSNEWSEPFDNTRRIKWKMKGNRRLTQTATN